MLNKGKLLEILNKGEVAIIPTDTVYGLHADGLNIDAINKVDKIKGSNKPHLLLISNVNMLKMYVKEMSFLHKLVIDKYWPGKLTILFIKSELVPNELTKGSEYVGIRMPNNKELLDIIESFGKPLLSTSANKSGEDVITDISMLDDSIKSNVSYIYDVGSLENMASTLIKIENNKIIFLRQGDLTNQIKSDFKEYL